MPYLTFSDLIDHALSYLGGSTDRSGSDRARRCVVQAYTELPTRHPWLFYQAIGRITTVASYTTGSIAYDHTGGASERLVTLTDGTWPAWAASGVLVIADVPYEVDARVSDALLTLTSGTNPGADVAAGTSYTLYQDTYALPADFLVAYEATLDSVGYDLAYRPPSEWVRLRRSNAGPGKPRTWTFTGDGATAGGMAARLWPPPDAVYAMDFLYRRRARRLVYDRREDGTASVAAGTTVTGANTSFTAGLVGSVIRVGADARAAVTGWDGDNPPAEERVVSEVASSTSLTVTEAFTRTLSGVRYVVSDPADVEQDVAGRYLLREVERQCRLLARMKANPGEDVEYQRALTEAREADSRYAGDRAAGAGGYPRYRLRDHPRGTEFQ